MNIMNELTLKHIKKNKAKTIVTIIGIIISVAMLTAVTTGMKSGLRWFRNAEIEESGKWHARFDHVTVSQFEQLKQNEEMEEVFAVKELGYAKVESQDVTKPYVFISAYEHQALQDMPVKVQQGRLPQKENEIIISSELADGSKKAPKVGDTVTYTIGERFLKETNNEEVLRENRIEKEKPMTQRDKYLDGTEQLFSHEQATITAVASEELKKTIGERTYTIVGIMERPGMNQEPFSAPGFSAYTYFNAAALGKEDMVHAYCYYKNVTKAIYDKMNVTAQQMGLDQPSDVNSDVLYYEGVSPDRRFTMFITMMYMILIGIIVIGSVSLIYNSFAISISERSKQLGMLASVGATKRQKRNSVFFEALVYGCIGIPIGIISGIVGISIVFKIVGNMLTGAFPIKAKLETVISIESILASAGLAFATIFVSAYLPARKASKISPMQAIRQTTQIKVKEKKVRTSWITRKLFGFEGELAQKNMKRNRKRYHSIIFALVISIVLFISVSAYLQYVTKAYVMTNGEGGYDICLNLYQGREEKSFKKKMQQDEKIYDAVGKLDDVTSITMAKTASFSLDENKVEQYLSSELKEVQQAGLMDEPYISIMLLDDQSFDSYCKEEGIDPQKVRSTQHGVVLLNTLESKMDYKLRRFPIFTMKEGMTVSTKAEDSYAAVDLVVSGIANNLAPGMKEYPNVRYNTVQMIAPKSNFEKICVDARKQKGEEVLGAETSIYVNVKDDAAVEKQMKAIIEEQKVDKKGYYIINEKKENRTMQQMVYAVSIFAYGFIILMSMICCANMCNTISTSIALRRTEFAMLKSVGMTPKKFHKMIRYESLLYGAKALLYGMPISLLVSYVIYKYVISRFTISFFLSWYIYVGAAVLVFVVVSVAMAYSSNKVRKENIIDGLKNETY